MSEVSTDIVECDMNRIMIVDDESSIRNLFRGIVSSAFPKLVVDIAGNGIEAVKKFQEGHQAVILMDIKMPEMDGLQAFAAIQDYCYKTNWSMPPVVFCTGFCPPDAIEEIIGDASYHRLLQKPVRGDTIVSTVGLLLQPV